MNISNVNRQLPSPSGFSTKAVHAGQDPEQWDSLCLIPPLVMSTTFKHNGDVKIQNVSQVHFKAT